MTTSTKKALTKKADRLVGTFVKDRDGRTCQLVGFGGPCGGPLDWCHLIPRGGRGTSVRWSPLNAVAGCRRHHDLMDSSPAARAAWAEARLGAAVWEHLQLIARTTRQPDPRDVVAAFRLSERSTP